MNKLLRITEKTKYEMGKLLPNDGMTERLADYFQNFADQTRVRIISALSIGDLCVNDLSELLSLNQTTVSHQLKMLKDQALVSYRREGKILVYHLKHQDVNEMMLHAIKILDEPFAE